MGMERRAKFQRGAEKWLIDFQIVTLYNVGQTERDVFS